MFFLIAVVVLSGLALWYSIGLLGSRIGLAARGSNDWKFGRRIALGGPFNLLGATLFAMLKRN